MSEDTFNTNLSNPCDEVIGDVNDGLRLHWNPCLKIGYARTFLGAQLDLMTFDNDEYTAFFVSYVTDGETGFMHSVASIILP